MSDWAGTTQYDLEVGDLNGDGYEDYVYASYSSPSEIYFGNGDGTQQTSMRYSTARSTYDIELFDADGDGDLDLAEANLNQPNYLFINDGLGNFGPPQVMFDNTVGRNRYSYGVKSSDFDNDGDLDMFVMTRTNTPSISGNHQLYLNDGLGNFVEAPLDTTFNTFYNRDMEIADLNNDGNEDIIVITDVANATYPSVIYYSNGDGTFAPEVVAFNDSLGYGLDFGDINGDGWLDAVVVGNGENLLYYNDGAG
jgi:hypothetical protein